MWQKLGIFRIIVKVICSYNLFYVLHHLQSFIFRLEHVYLTYEWRGISTTFWSQQIRLEIGGHGGHLLNKRNLWLVNKLPPCPPIFCLICWDQNVVLIPLSVLSNSSVTCEQCGESFSKLFNLQMHGGVHKETTSTITWEVCGASFSTLGNLNKHVDMVHQACEDTKEDRRFECSNCNKNFASRFTLQRHVKTHMKLKTNEI